MTRLDQHLLNDWQRDLPLVPAPFAHIAAALGSTEAEVIGRLEELQRRGLVSRVGAVLRPGALGCSTLAAMAVPPARLEEVAALVNAHPEVNHNYEREHRLNLWFVAAARDAAHLERVLCEIGARSGLPVLSLPMLADYHIDLGFPLQGAARAPRRRAPRRTPPRPPAGPAELALLAALEGGLPLVPRPWAALAERAGLTEAAAIAALDALLARGVVRRLGVVVRHHELGYRANAMVAWDVADARVDAIGARMAQAPWVTLCYRRARHLPEWPNNLYCMIHGRDRDTVQAQIAALAADCGLAQAPREVLFSGRRFRQRGARYLQGGPGGDSAAA